MPQISFFFLNMVWSKHALEVPSLEDYLKSMDFKMHGMGIFGKQWGFAYEVTKAQLCGMCRFREICKIAHFQ